MRAAAWPDARNAQVPPATLYGRRFLFYIVDRANTGMHILELSGAARKIANFN